MRPRALNKTAIAGVVALACLFIVAPFATSALTMDELMAAAGRSSVGMVLGVSTGQQWYASPTGSPSGDGSQNNPWDLQTALCGGPHSNLCNNYLKIADTLISQYGGSNNPQVQPGDTIWLLGGTYGLGHQSIYYSNLIGTASQPIFVRQYQGTRASVNGSLYVYGDYVWFWGFEVFNSNAYRVINSCGTPSGSNDNPYIGESFKLYAKGTKLINLVIHDESNIADQNEASQTELYGNLLYNTGWDDSTYNGNNCRGHGHSIYSQNDTSGTVKTYENNILYNSFDTNINVYGGAPNIWHLHFIGNTVFNPGMHADRRISNITLGGGQVWHDDIVFDSNVVYQALNTPPIGSSYNDMEPSWSGQQGNDLTLLNNYWIGSPTSIYGTLFLKNWRKVNLQNNMFVGPLTTMDGWTLGTVTGSNNKYFASHPYPGTDTSSQVSPNIPTGLNVNIRPNKYEPGRANITVMNWDKKPSVQIDLSSAGIPDGTDFEVRDAQNYWGAPAYSGTYHASSPVITLPMAGKSAPVSQLLGSVDTGDVVPALPPHTSEEFGAFVLLPKGQAATPPPSSPVSNPAPVNAKPIGHVDGVKSDGTVYGWAEDPDNSGAAVQVHIYVDSNAGTPGASPVAAVTASDNRSDIGNHAFNFKLPASYQDGKQHSVWVWGIDLTDSTGSSNAQLGGSPVSFTLAAPVTSPVTVVQPISQPAAPTQPIVTNVYVPIPTISPATGYYYNSVSVTLADDLSGAQIYYTTDGSTPTQSSNLYSGPVTITKSLALKAVAYVGNVPSGVASNSYGIINTTSTTVIAPAPVTVTTSTPVTITPPVATSPTSGSVSSPAPVGSWSFDAGTVSGSTITDTSGNNMTGTTIGNPTMTAGRSGQAASFDGINSYIAFANDAKAALVGNLTLSAWIKTTNNKRDEAILSRYDATAQEYGYIFKTLASGHVGIRFGGNTTSGDRELADTGKLVNDGQWHHVAVVMTLGQDVKFYIDGVLSSSVSAATVATVQGAPLLLGGSAWPPYGNNFTGQIDQAAIYNQALSATQIAQLAQ